MSCPSHLFNVPLVYFPFPLSLPQSWPLLHCSLGGLQQPPNLSLHLQSCPQSVLYTEAKVPLLNTNLMSCHMLLACSPDSNHMEFISVLRVPCPWALSHAVPSVENTYQYVPSLFGSVLLVLRISPWTILLHSFPWPPIPNYLRDPSCLLSK